MLGMSRAEWRSAQAACSSSTKTATTTSHQIFSIDSVDEEEDENSQESNNLISNGKQVLYKETSFLVPVESGGRLAARRPSVTNNSDFERLNEPDRKIKIIYVDSESSSRTDLDRISYTKMNTVKKEKLLNSSSSNYKKKGPHRGTIYSQLSSSPANRIQINVGGVRFETYKSTLRLISESRLANLTPTNSDYDPVRREYFFDRDPASFQAILNYFRTGKLHAPNSVCGNLFHDELIYWGIGERCIQPCCWTAYSAKRECDQILRKLANNFDEEYLPEDQPREFLAIAPTNSEENIENGEETSKKSARNINKNNWLILYLSQFIKRCRPHVWRFLDDRKSSKAAAIYFWISVVFLAISIGNFVLETTPYFRTFRKFSNKTNVPIEAMTRKERDDNTKPNELLLSIELICNWFFATEFCLRFISSPNKIKFIRNPYHFLEFLAISPLFFPAGDLDNPASLQRLSVRIRNYIEVFYILRVLRIFTLVPKYSGLRMLLLTLKNSIGELILYIMMLFMTMMLFASFIYYAEQIFEKEDNKFDNILIGFWWAIVTMTTLGYGDYVPVTPVGYIIGGMCAISGLLFMALPVPLIVNNFTLFYSYAKARQKLKDYSSKNQDLPKRAIVLHLQTSEMKQLSAKNHRQLNHNCNDSIVSSSRDDMIYHFNNRFNKEQSSTGSRFGSTTDARSYVLMNSLNKKAKRSLRKPADIRKTYRYLQVLSRINKQRRNAISTTFD